MNENVRLHRHRQGWRQGVFASLDYPNVMVELEGRFYPTHSTRVRLYFGEISIPPQIMGEQLLYGRPDPLPPDSTSLCSNIGPNQIFVTSHRTVNRNLLFVIYDMTQSLSLSPLNTFEMDSDSIFLAVTKVVKDEKSHSPLTNRNSTKPSAKKFTSCSRTPSNPYRSKIYECLDLTHEIGSLEKYCKR